MYIQWNPSNEDTNGAEESVLYREVSLFQGLKEWYLWRQKVSLLERCPQFRGVLIEGFHCIRFVCFLPSTAVGSDCVLDFLEEENKVGPHTHTLYNIDMS